jgi:hypothetical protein
MIGFIRCCLDTSIVGNKWWTWWLWKPPKNPSENKEGSHWLWLWAVIKVWIPKSYEAPASPSVHEVSIKWLGANLAMNIDDIACIK